MVRITAKPGARKGMTPKTAPNYFHFQSTAVRMVVENTGPNRHEKRRLSSGVRINAGCGSKILKAFRASGVREFHATKPQFPCYGRRSERG